MSNELKELSLKEVAGCLSNGFISNLVANLMLIKGEFKSFNIDELTMICNSMRQDGYELGRKSIASDADKWVGNLPLYEVEDGRMKREIDGRFVRLSDVRAALSAAGIEVKK